MIRAGKIPKKMNAAMMREQLQQEYPNIFSLPGETEIKNISTNYSARQSQENQTFKMNKIVISKTTMKMMIILIQPSGKECCKI